MKFWLVGAGYWGSKVRAELDTIPGVGSVETIDIKTVKQLTISTQQIQILGLHHFGSMLNK